MQQEWTDEHHRMARWLGYHGDWANVQDAAQDVQRMVNLHRAKGDEALQIEMSRRAAPPETQLHVLREIRDLLKQIKDHKAG